MSQKHRKPDEALTRLAALAGSVKMDAAASTIGMTLISGVGCGAFPCSVRYLGSVAYLVLEVTAHNKQLLMRGYTAGIGQFQHEVLIGSARFNTLAFDLSGLSRLRRPENRAVALAGQRLLLDMSESTDSELHDQDSQSSRRVRWLPRAVRDAVNLVTPETVVLPELLVEVPAAVLQRGCDSPALVEEGRRLRAAAHQLPQFRAPVSGRIVDVTPVPDTNDELAYVVIEDAHGQRHSVLLPSDSDVTFSSVPGCYDEVQAGAQLVSSLENVSDTVCQDLAWMSIIRTVKTVNGEVTVVPMRFVSPAIRRQTVQPVHLYEDVSALLGPKLSNPAHEVLAQIDQSKSILNADPATQNYALDKFRQKLEEFAAFGSDEDLLQALANPDQPLQLSGMACVQQWRISDQQSLRLRRADCYADFWGLRQQWANLLTRADLVPVLTQAHQLGQAAKVAGQRYEAAALQILQQYPMLCAEQISRLQLFSRNPDSSTSEEYLQRVTDAAEARHAQTVS